MTSPPPPYHEHTYIEQFRPNPLASWISSTDFSGITIIFNRVTIIIIMSLLVITYCCTVLKVSYTTVSFMQLNVRVLIRPCD